MRNIINIATAVCILGVGTTLRAASPQYMITRLGDLGGASNALALNDAGQVVGVSYLQDGSYHAFLSSRSAGIEDLGTPATGDVNSAAGEISKSRPSHWIFPIQETAWWQDLPGKRKRAW